MKNTIVEYLYRDASNYKVWNTFTIAGELTKDEFQQLLATCDDGEYFIPDAVGMPARTFEDEGYDANDDDTPFFELVSFTLTDATLPEGTMPKQQLMKNFNHMSGHWAEYLLGVYPGCWSI